MRNLLFIISAIGILWLAACRERSTAPPTSPSPPPLSSTPEEEVPADFAAFYRQFHADSVFQVQHISWPLPGQVTAQEPDGRWKRKSTYWERSTWRFQHAVDFSTGEFKRQLRAMEDQYVVEIIAYASAPNYALERRFMRRSDGNWELVYYADMQER